MNRILNILLTTVVLVSCKSPTQDCALTGLWSLTSFEVQDSTGKWVPYSWNQGGTGYLMYDGKGHVALHITPKDYSQFRWEGIGAIDTLSLEQMQSALRTIAANYNYIGEAKIDHKNGIISHKRLSHSRPEDWGKTVQRRFSFLACDTLEMAPVEGERPRRLNWLRVSN